MKLKKINAILGLTIIAALVCHVGTMTYSLITYWYDLTLCKFFAHAAVTLMILHILTSLCIFFFFHDGSSAHYLSMNKRTIIQRITAILMIVFVHFHIFAYSHMATGETLSQGQRYSDASRNVSLLFRHLYIPPCHSAKRLQPWG